VLGVDPPNLTTVVDGLESARLVERQAHLPDRQAEIVVAPLPVQRWADGLSQILKRLPVGPSEVLANDLESLDTSCPGSDGIGSRAPFDPPGHSRFVESPVEVGDPSRNRWWNRCGDALSWMGRSGGVVPTDDRH